MRTSNLLTSVLLYISFTSAVQWREAWSDGTALAAEAVHDLLKRQGITLGDATGTPNPTDVITTSQPSSSFDSSAAASSLESAGQSSGGSAAATTTGDSAATTSGQSASSRSGGRSSGATSTTGSQSGSSRTQSSSTSSISIDPEAGAGGVSMIEPNTVLTTTYYKISDYVTFAWNYTSLSVTPTAIDILASCSTNGLTYTIAQNQSVAGPTGNVTWDTNQYATQPLVVGTYTLIIHDAAKDVSATPSPGYLGAYDQFTFAMYTKQPYVDLDQFVCVTCSGALSNMERQTLGFLLTMAVVAVLSFTIFAGNAGVF